MNRNYHNSRGLSTHDRNSIPRWRTVFIGLVLVVVIRSAGQPYPVQAAPPGATELKFMMLANKEKPGQICTGELVHINVLVYRYKLVGGVSGSPDTVTGVTVNGWSNNPNIGQISPRKNTTIWSSSIYSGAADFVFRAENPGNTVITFDATVATPGWFGTNWGGGSKTVTTSVDVQVIPCKYKIEAVGQWHEASDGAYYSITSVTEQTVITADADGHYTGSASVNWAGTGRTGNGCEISFQADSGLAHYAGEVDESGQLVLKQTYEPVKASDSYDCGNESGWAKGLVSSDPISLHIPGPGGVFTPSHVLNLDWWVPMSGSITFVVIPEEDAAVSLSSGDQQASWDNFSNLFGALLALH